MLRAVILAAGASSRMGRAKAVLPLGSTGDTVLSRSLRGLLEGGLTDITVVAGAHIDAVRAVMPFRDPRVRMIEHRGWEQGQLSSLVAGLDAIESMAGAGIKG